MGLWRPDARMKWPSRSAPAARNSASTSSVVIRVGFLATLSCDDASTAEEAGRQPMAVTGLVMDARRYAAGGAPAPATMTPAAQARVWASVAARIEALAESRPPAETSRPLPPRRVFPPEFPEGLKPRLRLFLSVDLVGSTSYKQSRQSWSPEILSFYRNFDYALQAQYRAFSEGHKTALPAPEFWKSNGDELLYVCA